MQGYVRALLHRVAKEMVQHAGTREVFHFLINLHVSAEKGEYYYLTLSKDAEKE